MFGRLLRGPVCVASSLRRLRPDERTSIWRRAKWRANCRARRHGGGSTCGPCRGHAHHAQNTAEVSPPRALLTSVQVEQPDKEQNKGPRNSRCQQRHLRRLRGTLSMEASLRLRRVVADRKE